MTNVFGPNKAISEIRFGVTRADIRVDSDNNAAKTTTFTDHDEQIEFSTKPEHIGKILLETSDDVDHDGVMDSLDGLGLEDIGGSPKAANLKLVPMKVKLEKPYDPSRAKVTFHYNASVPRLDPYGINVTVTDGVSSYEIAKRGLRLWKVDGYQRDNGIDVTTNGGHFIPSATAIPWSAIAPPAPSGGSIPDETTLYLEFVDLPTGKTYSKEDIVYTIREEGVPEAGKGYIKTHGILNPAYLAEKESPDGLCVNLLQAELDVIADADNDGMDDDWELANELDPADPADADYDYDEDWISNLYEYLLGFDPWNDSTGGTFDALADRDGDGVSDMDEAMLGEWIWDTALERYAFIRKLDWEIHDANDDSDGDGVGKYDELLAGTDPYKADTDGDGLLDGWEIANKLNPNDDGTGNINNGGSGDPDNDGLTNAQEQQLGTDPNNPDSDGDGMSDSLEVAAGTDPGNQDTDGDGFPDSIDPQPLASAFAFTDADRDGIPDVNDADPNEARGPAPSIASETVSGNPVSNLIQDETVKFVFMVSNPGGPAPTASNLTFFLNGIADTAQTTSITAIGSPVGSSQRFLLTWLAKTTANYPALTLQNLTLRFRDSQHATSWINLARIDVAEWEGMIAGIPDQILDASDADRWVAKVASHLNGRKTSPFELAGSHRISGGYRYRGPLAVKLLDADGRTEKGMATIPSGVRYPMMVIKRQSASMPFAASRIVDISSPEVIPARCIGHLNKSGYKVTMTVPNGSVTLMPNEMKFKSLPDQPETPDNMYRRLGSTVAIVEGEEGVLFHDSYVSAPGFSLYSRTLDMGIFENNPEPARDWPLFESYGLFISLEKSITPHAAGSLEYPGLPQPRGNLEDTAPLLMAAEQWHKIVLKAGPDTAALSNGIQLKIGSGVNGDEAPQSGFALKTQNASGAFEDITVPPAGKITLRPDDPNPQRYQQAISSAGLTLFLMRSASVSDAHVFRLQLLKKHEWQPQESVQIADMDLLPCEIVPDWNRDGKIDAMDCGQVASSNPWRFWVNDDNDKGDTEGTDIPLGSGASDINAKNALVDGMRDLVDFFPVHLDLKGILEVLPQGEYRYRLTHSHPAEDPSVRVVIAPSLHPSSAGTYLKSFNIAQALQSEQSRPIHSTGPLLSSEILQAAQNGQGLLFIEGVKQTSEPVIVKVERIQDNRLVAEIPFHVRVTDVEDMFRHKNLRLDAASNEPTKEANYPPALERLGEPANLPDHLCNEDWIVFLHGYNVNGKGARGWHSEAFKRLFWSGNKARFVGISWYGDETQKQIAGNNVCPKYYENVENALNTSGHLSAFVNALDGGKKYLVAHSLGGLVTSYAIAHQGMNAEKAFLFDPALPTEALLPATSILNDIHMEPLGWRPYPEEIKSSEWYRLFQPVGVELGLNLPVDERFNLSWRGLVHAAVPKLKIFFSEGEEVLAALPFNMVPDPGWAGDDPQGQFAFCLQAMLKGMLGNEPDVPQDNIFWGSVASFMTHAFGGKSPASLHAGWKWTKGEVNPFYDILDTEGRLDKMPPITFVGWLEDPAFSERLKTDPVFGLSVPPGCEGLFHATNGHTVASVAWKHRRILAQMIPERTLPAGGAGGSGVAGEPDENNNPTFDVISLEDKAVLSGSEIQVFDMQEKRNGWPQSREDPVPGNGWRHGDIREVAYVYVWKSWQEIVNDGNLNRKPQTNN